MNIVRWLNPLRFLASIFKPLQKFVSRYLPFKQEKMSKLIRMAKTQTYEIWHHKNPMIRNTAKAWLLFILLLFPGIVIEKLNRHEKHQALHKHKRAPLVVMAKATKRDVPIYLTALGSVTPLNSITVKTQVNGQLINVPFQEGQFLNTGDVLAEIDPRPFQALLTQYEGQLAKDKALLANAKLDLERYTVLYRQDSVSKQIYDTQVHLVKQYEGAVKSDEGLVETAKVNLSFCQISSPISGQVGLRLVDPGNLVQTTDANGIAVVNRLQPITVIFTIPEDNVPQVTKKLNANQELKVEAFDRTQSQHLATGKLLALDNQIDPTTGTLKIKAEFENEGYTLYPNQFVNVRLLVETLENATVVPTSSIQNGVKGPFVYLLEGNNKVKLTPVIKGVTVGDDTVIEKGIEPGQSVVVEGTDKITDGASVTLSLVSNNHSQTP